jgi:hypothetical protein
MINLFVKQPLDSYGVYKEKTCDIKNCTDNNECPIKESDESSSDELACEARYAAYKENMKQSNLRYTRETISPLLSAITVGITLYLLNRKQKKVK